MTLLRICLLISIAVTALPAISIASGVISLPATGQTGSTGAAWPSPRSVKNADGSISDNLTGLMWAGNGNLDGLVSWQSALDYVKQLNTDKYLSYSDWRLPNVNELSSLYDYSKSTPAVALAFTSLAPSSYWSSTSYTGDPTLAWTANLQTPAIGYAVKSAQYALLPVRGGKTFSATDTSAPTILAFRLPATSTTRTVIIDELTTIDDRSVTGFFLSEDPAANPAATAAGWGISITFAFAGDGNRNLYAWAKDAAGNVSQRKDASIAITAASPDSAYVPTVQLPATGLINPTAPERGVAWPAPRFTATGAWTVADHLTGLMWAQQGNLMTVRDPSFDADGSSTPDGQVTWQHALDYVKKLNTDTYLGFNDWRLPNVNELASLFVFDSSEVRPFTDLGTTAYWTSTSYPSAVPQAWTANLQTPAIGYQAKTATSAVLPVRGGRTVSATDAATPTILAFRLPATSTSRTVTIEELTTVDDRSVTGLFLSESPATPAATAAGWGIAITFTFAGDGNRTLYAWAKDSAGNVSARKDAAITVTAASPDPAYAPTVQLPVTGLINQTTPERGVTWPAPRFTAIGAWTVSDRMTGLMWVQQGNLTTVRDPSFDSTDSAGTGLLTWQHALDYVKKLNTDSYLGFNDWRLPNVNELASLFVFDPSEVRPFTDLGITYWTSTSYTGDATYAWTANLQTPGIGYQLKTGTYAVLPVRGGRSVTATDAAAPTILAFRLPSTSASRTVTIEELTTVDDRSVTGLFLSESSSTPAATAAGWGISITFTFAGNGNKTLYAWAKDAAGNVSPQASAAISITGGSAAPAYAPTVQLPATGLINPNAPELGVAWPAPRFTAIGAWTVSDRMTGLMWAQQGNLVTVRDPSFDIDGSTSDGQVTWQHALDYLKKLNTDKYLGFSDWRLPNVNELASLFTFDPSEIRPFTDLGTTYWTSTSYKGDASYAWSANLKTPALGYRPKTDQFGLLPVRGGTVITTAADANAPIIVSFKLPAASDSRSVTIKELTTTDDKGVVSFWLSEDGTTPLASAAGWGIAINHTFASDGACTLYAWVKDAAGNVSARAEASIAIAGGSAAAPVYAPTIKLPATGMTGKLLDGDDGDLRKGAAWPAARFTAVGPWVVSDALTGLVWVQQGNLMSVRDPSFDTDIPTGDGLVTWQHALNYVKKLNTDKYLGFSDWRLPNVNELAGLFAFDASITRPFTDLATTYWSSTSYAGDASQAWTVNVQTPALGYAIKSGINGSLLPVLPVRGGSNSLQGTDAAPPQIVGFALPAVWDSLTAPILDLSANDNVGIAGYLLSETTATPGANDGGWQSLRPTNYTFASAGEKTVYAWVKDAAGNVSAPASAATTVSALALTPPSQKVLLQTGQTACFDSNGVQLSSCDASGQDGLERVGVALPTTRFDKRFVGVVTDTLTGLVWLRDGSLAKTLNRPNTDANGAMTWQSALEFVAYLNEHTYLKKSDWRLPNIDDLRTLADYSQGANLRKALENSAITQGLMEGSYWSSTSYAPDPRNAWTFSMTDGSLSQVAKTGSNYTLAISGGGGGQLTYADTDQATCSNTQGNVVDCAGTGQDGEIALGQQPLSPRFDVSRPLVFTDLATGLIWSNQQNPIKFLVPDFDSDGTAGDGAVSWQHALDFVRLINQGSYLGYSDWRLPNINELLSLVSREAASPSGWLSGNAFGYVEPTSFWSSTSYPSANYNYAWLLDLATGGTMKDGKGAFHQILLVRSGSGASPASLTVYKSGNGVGTVAGDSGRIACGGDCFESYASPGGSATLTATAEPGSTFIGWSGACSGTGGCTVSLLGDVYVTASFSRPAAQVVTMDSGQRVCYDLANNPVACGSTGALAGDGAAITGPQLTLDRFHDNGNATVTDRLSGLTIPQDLNPMASLDSSFDADGTSGDGFVTWLHALDYIEMLNRGKYLGFSDWRLPNLNELRAFADYGAKSALASWNDMGLLINLPSIPFWSSTGYEPNRAYAWTLDPNSGVLTTAGKAAANAVLPVRGGNGIALTMRTNQTSCSDSGGTLIPCAGTGQDADTLRGEVWPAPRFAVSNDSPILTDQATTLVWPVDANIMKSNYNTGSAPFDTQGDRDGAVTWQQAVQFIDLINKDAVLGFSDWRLPTVTELATLVNYGSAANLDWLSNNSAWFLQLSDGNFWSSTTWSQGGSQGWYVNLASGGIGIQGKSTANYLIPVRGGSGFGAASLVVIKAGSGSGTVAGQQGSGIACGSACFSAYAKAGTSVTLTATPDAGFAFLGWAGGGCTGTDPCTLPVNGAMLVTAVFGSPQLLPHAGVARTGQTACYDPVSGVAVGCASSGQDGDKLTGAAWPDPRFSQNGSIITDNLTGLVFPKAANNAAGSGAVSWQHALDLVASLNADSYLGFADWRLPNINELTSLMNADKSDTATWLMSAETGFTDVRQKYWSSSSKGGASAWVMIDFATVTGALKSDTTNYFVIPVRNASGRFKITLPATGQAGCWNTLGAPILCAGTGQDGALRSGTALPEVRFGVNRDGTVSDLLTGLIWTANGNAPGPAACAASGSAMNWGQAIAHVGCLNTNSYLGQKDWRLPNVNELSSIMNRGMASPGAWLGQNGFDTVSGVYWTSTSRNPNPNAQTVNAADGDIGYQGYSALLRVIPVRGGTLGTAASIYVNKTGSGDGSVDSTPAGISCGADCDQLFPTAGGSMTLTATQDAASTFLGWLGGCSGAAKGCTVALNGDINVTARFAKNYPLTVSAGGNGTGTVTSLPAGINCGGTAGACSALFADTTSVVLSASAADGYFFDRWSGCTSSDGPTCTVGIAGAAGVTAYFYNKPLTSAALMLSSETILNNTTIDLSGKLTAFPDGQDLNALQVALQVTAPDNSTTTTLLTTGNIGQFGLKGLGNFTQKGTYSIKAVCAGTDRLSASSSPVQNLLVGASAGYAVIVEGKIASGDGMPSHNKTTNRIYLALKSRGFEDANIQYFNYNTNQADAGITVDGLPTKANIQSAIQGMASRMINSPAPLYIVMVNHGEPGVFHLDGDFIAPSDVKTWLDNLEGALAAYPEALQQKRIFIDGSCYSGSFIPVLSKQGRIIITSAAADEESYMGTVESSDNVRSGEFFLDTLFEQLKKGLSLNDAFANASQATRLYTRKGGLVANSATYGDASVQHPLLDDDGDGRGSNMLSGQGDGTAAAAVYLGVGLNATNAPAGPADIKTVPPTQFLDAAVSSADTWLQVTVPSRALGWVEVRSPSIKLETTGSALQVPVPSTKVLLSADSTGKFVPLAPFSFTEPGMYELYYYTQDVQNNLKTPMVRGVVYKSAALGAQTSAVTLTSPADGDKVKTTAVFQWTGATGPDNDPFTYTLEIATDDAFTNPIRQEEIRTTSAYVLDGLKDATSYYWRVKTVDQYGARVSSSVSRFSTDNTNGLGGLILGYVRGSATGVPISGVSIIINGNIAAVSDVGGAYLLYRPTGNFSVRASKSGYLDQSLSAVVTAGKAVQKDFKLEAAGAPPAKAGDCDRNGTLTAVEVRDAVGMYLGLKPVLTCVDSDNGGAVSGAELQKVMNSF